MGIALVGYVASRPRRRASCPSGASATRWRSSRASTRSAVVNALFNPFAAVPSMHVAFALMLGCRWRAWRARRWAQVAVGALPRAGHLRGRRHRQPLVARRVPRRADRRASPRSPPRRVRPRPARRPGRGTRAARRSAGRPAAEVAAPPPARGRRGAATTRAHAQPADRVAPDAERDLAHRLRAVRRRRRARLAGRLLSGGLAFVVGSVCDTLDGRYSRMSGKGTPFGAFLDSTLDRIEEGIVLDRRRRATSPRRATTSRSPRW